MHGFPLDRRQWRAQAAEPAVASFDLPGFGSAPPPDPLPEVLTMDALAGAVLAEADRLGFPRFVLGGLSMGGYVALAVLRRARERVAGLILSNTRAEADPPGRVEFRRRDAAEVLASGLGDRPATQAKTLLSPRTHAGAPELVRLVEDMVGAAAPAVYAAAQRGMAARPDATGELGAIDVPTLCLAGADDGVTPAEGMRTMAAAIRGAELVVLADAGHLAPLERPDEANAAIRRLRARVG